MEIYTNGRDIFLNITIFFHTFTVQCHKIILCNISFFFTYPEGNFPPYYCGWIKWLWVCCGKNILSKWSQGIKV